MKVAIPTNRGDKIARHSSFCRSFVIIDTESGSRMTIDNPLQEVARFAKADPQSGERRALGKGRVIAGILADAGVNVCLCIETGEAFVMRLAERGIALYITAERQIDRALQLLAEGTLSPCRVAEGGFRRGRGAGFGGRRARGAGRSRGFGRGMRAR